MANEIAIQVFEYEEARYPLSPVVENNQTWFRASEVCAATGHLDQWKAVKQHVDSKDQVKRPVLTAGGKQNAAFINESGLYALVLAGQTERCKAFKHWVTSKVLPSIRQTGTYSVTPDRQLSALAVSVRSLETQLKGIFELVTLVNEHRNGNQMDFQRLINAQERLEAKFDALMDQPAEPKNALRFISLAPKEDIVLFMAVTDMPVSPSRRAYVQNELIRRGYQLRTRSRGFYSLTDDGKKAHGKTRKNGHRTFIVWPKSLLDEILSAVFN